MKRRAFEALYQAGKVRAIGLSNFRPGISKTSCAPDLGPSPWLTRSSSIGWRSGRPVRSAARTAAVEGWSPLARAAYSGARNRGHVRKNTAARSRSSVCAGRFLA